jgi:uncharacterized membrane protein YczE
MDVFIDILWCDLTTLAEYLSFQVVTCLIPAFFIAGAIAIFISQGAVIKYLDLIVDSLEKLSERAIPRVRDKTVYKALLRRQQ